MKACAARAAGEWHGRFFLREPHAGGIVLERLPNLKVEAQMWLQSLARQYLSSVRPSRKATLSPHQRSSAFVGLGAGGDIKGGRRTH
jgi:hypothetical protein